jgi:hypothetical protein
LLKIDLLKLCLGLVAVVMILAFVVYAIYKLGFRFIDYFLRLSALNQGLVVMSVLLLIAFFCVLYEVRK